MREFIHSYFSLIFKIGIAVIVLATLFLFTNLTTEFYEAPKFIVLLIFTGISLILLTLKFTVTGRVTFNRTPLDLPLLLILVVAIFSTFLSPAPYISLLGNQLRVSSSLVALITYVLFYFILTNNLKSIRDIKRLTFLLIAAGGVLSVVTLLAYGGTTLLPRTWTHGTNFTPTGSAFSTTAVLAMLIPLLVSNIFTSTNLTYKFANSVLLTLFGIIIGLTGNLSTWVAAVLAFALSFLVYSPIKTLSQVSPATLTGLLGLIGPVVLVVLVVALSFIPPVGKAQNPLYTQAKNFPREIQLPFNISWKASVSSFRDSPFWGTGPSTYLFNFTNYKPIEFNKLKFWNLRFDTPFNEYLHALATLGGIGLLALLSLTALFLSSALKALKPHQSLTAALAISGIVFFAILALHASTLVVWIIGLIILASYMAVSFINQPVRETISTNRGNLTQNLLRVSLSSSASEETVRIDALPSILLIISSALMGVSFFFGGKFVLADISHRQALNAVSQNQGVVAYNKLVAAEKLNPYNDLYRTDLAQTNFALASAIAQAKAPTDEAPQGSLTDEDKQNIQTLLQQSINEARTAVALSPRSAANWEILAALYRQISGVAQNALVFSLDSYGRAIFQDPLNPNLRLNVGGTYYAIQNYDLAIRFFTDAINLKPDYANGYYNLSVALRDKGDLNTAIAVAEKAVQFVEPNSQDFKVATDYLNDLKNKASGGPAQPPAAEGTGVLQKEELPKVVDVGTPPEKIATPPAIKASPTPRP